MTYQFAIKVIELKNGDTTFIPVVRRKGGLIRPHGYWQRIVKVYDRYELIDIDFTPQLTNNECIEHLYGYKQQFLNNEANQINKVSINVVGDEIKITEDKW